MLQRCVLGLVGCSKAQEAPGSQPLPPDDQVGIARAGGEGMLSESGLRPGRLPESSGLPTGKTMPALRQ